MVLNRRGMTAMVDAMAFMIIMMAVLSLSIHQLDPGENGFSDAGNVLDSLTGVEVRTSDLTDLEDDTLVYLTDLLAYGLVNGDTKASDYAESVLEIRCAGRLYSLTLEYGEKKTVLGTGFDNAASSAHREIPVSVGGCLAMDLRISS